MLNRKEIEMFVFCLIKDLGSPLMYEVGLAMSGLACFINADLARDLANDIMSLVNPIDSVFLLFRNQDFV